MKVFVLEDDPNRIVALAKLLEREDVTWIHTCFRADEFKPPYDLILLDHDLGGRQMVESEDSGLTFVRMVKEKINSDAIVVIHSYNLAGAKAMQSELNVGVICPFGSKLFKIIEHLKKEKQK